MPVPAYSATSRVIRHPAEIERDWLQLQERADCSFFQSWGWIGNWLEQIAMDLHPLVVRVWFEGTLVGLGIVTDKHISRHLVIRSDARFVHEYPFDDRNMVIEYNGLLADRGHEQAVYSETINHLLQIEPACDELYFSALGERAYRFLCDSAETRLTDIASIRLLEESPAYSVSLDYPGDGIDAYLATLNKNRRLQIRRSLRLYGERTPLSLESANSTEEALDFLDGLKELHTDRWQAEGRRGAFANRRWEVFHRSLVAARFGPGEIQLLRVRNADGPIGYLYNFVWRGHVYVLQTGFRMPEDKRLMPGYVVHTLAIVHNRQLGMDIYDLMHGDSLYKRLLCNRKETLRWVAVQRKHWKFELEHRLLKMARRVLGRGKAAG
jgi:CelD/BcsL family acetyltransferase involved in cellulose biosynthesis